MIISVSVKISELAVIDELAEESGETRSAFMVRTAIAGGPERQPSKRQLRAIAERVRAVILGHR